MKWDVRKKKKKKKEVKGKEKGKKVSQELFKKKAKTRGGSIT